MRGLGGSRIVCAVMSLPPLRYVDVVPIEHDGDTYIVLRDPEGYVEHELMVSAPAFFIAAHLDGTNGIAEIQAAFAKQYGVRAEESDIRAVIEDLERAGYLVGEPFLRLKTRIDDGYRRCVSRPAYLAGKSYPSDPAELRSMIDEFFTGEGGPGGLPTPRKNDGACLSCLVVPHIDYHRGGAAYGHGYLELARHGAPKTAFLFGVAHCGVPVPYVLTRKGFDTPFGTLPVHGDAVDELAAACDWDPYAYEAVHRTEHSLEFQAVMLAYLYGPEISIVPILCSAISENPETDKPAELDSINRFLDACTRIVAAAPDSTTVIAGADLAHVGTRFGDAFEIDDSIVAGVAARDFTDLGHATECRPDAFYASVMKDRNKRRVCGINCIYAALRTAGEFAGPGTILHYNYAHDPAGGIVSFTATSFPPVSGGPAS